MPGAWKEVGRNKTYKNNTTGTEVVIASFTGQLFVHPNREEGERYGFWIGIQEFLRTHSLVSLEERLP